MYTVITCWQGSFSVLQYRTAEEAKKMTDTAETLNGKSQAQVIVQYGPDGYIQYYAARDHRGEWSHV